MKILHLRATNFYGGPERQLHLHALQARRRGIDMRLGSFTENGQVPRLLEAAAGDNLPVCVFEVRSAYDRRAARMVREYLLTESIDLICTHDYRTHLIGLLASRRLKTGWIAFSRGWTRENLKVRLSHLLDKTIVRLADSIVAVSEEQKRRLVRLLVPRTKIEVVHNAIDIERIAAVERIDLRARFTLPPDSLIAVAGGRFSREKGQLDLIRAAATVVEQEHRLHFVLFGDGPDLSMARQLLADRGLESRVLLPGFEKNLIGCLKTADILVNPSHTEGLPNIVLEGMAIGLPVLATRVGGVPELIEDRVNGLLVPARRPAALAEALVELSGAAEQRAQLGTAAAETVRHRFSFDSQAEKLYRVYEKVLGR